MSDNFWDVKIPDDEEKPVQQKEVEPAEIPAVEQSDKIQVDGSAAEFQLEKQTELSYEAIRASLERSSQSDEFWRIDLDQDRNSFFQMHFESGLIEHWQDGNIIHQQRGDIGQAMDYLESIIPKVIPNENSTPTDTIWLQTTPNNEVSTSQRILEMRSKDIQQLEQAGPKETYQFPNIASIIFGGVALIVTLISLINGAIFTVLIAGFISFIGLAIAYSLHTKIDHYPNDSTFVWYKARSIHFIYQKQAGDKIQHWKEVSYSTDSEGNKTSSTNYHFRIIDSSGGELYSSSSLSQSNRAKVTNLLSLPTGNANRRSGKIKYHDPGSPNFNVEQENNPLGIIRTVVSVPLIILLMFGFVIVSDIFISDEFGYDYEMPDRWCDGSVNYPVTVPLTVVGETSMDGYEHNREDGTYSDASLVANGGICTYRYRTGDSRAFEFVYELEEVSDIDGISMLVLFHPGGQTVGYSGLEVYTMTNNSSEWELQIDSPYMFGDYERYATFENYLDEFHFDLWFRHAFDSTAENVSQVKIVTGNADQLGDRSVSFSGLRVDAAGDYDYPDYLICSGEWDGLFENSTSDMVTWDSGVC